MFRHQLHAKPNLSILGEPRSLWPTQGYRSNATVVMSSLRAIYDTGQGLYHGQCYIDLWHQYLVAIFPGDLDNRVRTNLQRHPWRFLTCCQNSV